MDVAELSTVLEEVARRSHGETSLEEALDLLVTAAQQTVPGADHVSISISRRNGRLETIAASDDLVRRLDAVQHELGEGPCVEAVRQRQRRTSHDLHTDERWPRFAPRAVDLGVRSQMGLDLYDDGESIGGLNLYGDQPSAFDEASTHVAVLFGSHASHLLGRRMRESQLTAALGTRQLIGQATGIVMERYQLGAERAFEFLARVSQQGNRKLVEIAAELVDQAASARTRDHPDDDTGRGGWRHQDD
ncbi:GAF and ANTAR domain-containing protein [Auraticoccus monumenti]|uniref:GAF domain-containing protein n=1 Tax=Auraticoccus monumenti TaxID=675864 RepID=A0A1G7BW25_9ACTN|nr:GAF and ANTAR domain-containing protein [Auraticoccus monumenti]SDE31243.1 GAF domain-containing protein [Auraticoccus monumenti]